MIVVVVTNWASTSPEEIVFATAAPIKAPIKLVIAAKENCQAGREHLGGYDRRDGVGRVVEAIDVLKHQGHDKDREKQRHGTSGKGRRAQEFLSTI